MNDFYDLIKENLDSGKSADDVAALFTEQINKILAEKTANEQREKDDRELLGIVTKYLKKYYPEQAESLEIDEVSPKEFRAAIDDVFNALTMVNIICDGIKKEVKTVNRQEKICDPLTQFLNDNGLL